MSWIVFILLKAIVVQDGSWCWYLLLLSALDALTAGGKETHHSSGDKNQNRNADTFLISFHIILIINLIVLKALLIGASARAIAAFSMIPITVLKTR